MSDPIIKRVPLTDIFVDETFNCRGAILPLDVVDLAKDIQERGLIQPVSIIKNPNAKSTKPYMLIAGFRRFVAHRIIEEKSILCVLLEREMSESDRRLFNLAENIQRQNLNIIQEANALKKLKGLGLSEKDVADHLKISRGWVQVRYMILDLPAELHPDLMAGNITQSQVRQLYSIYKITAKKDTVFDAAKKMKNDKIKGITDRDYAPKTSATKKARGKREMFDMIDMIYDNFADYPQHRELAKMLGWAAGQVTDGELHKMFKKIADDNSIFWDIPTEYVED